MVLVVHIRRAYHLTILWCILVLSILVVGEIRPKLALCIGGQTARWLPTFVMKDLVLANPSVDMRIFFNLQAPHDLSQPLPVHSSGTGFEPSPMVFMNETAAHNYLSNLLLDSPGSKVVSVEYHLREGIEYWMKVVGGPLDRFKQRNMHHGTEIGVNIMNMYHGPAKCAKQIEVYEQSQSMESASGNSTPWRFDYIISTREDIFYFAPLNLTNIFPYLRVSNTSTLKSTGTCDVISKDCLTWGGMNLRMSIMNRDIGLKMLAKFDSYKTMRDLGWKPVNPEQFEQHQAMLYDASVCPLNSELLPFAAARHLVNETICMYDFEVKDCYPPSAAEQVKNITRCEDAEFLHAHARKLRRRR